MYSLLLLAYGKNDLQFFFFPFLHVISSPSAPHRPGYPVLNCKRVEKGRASLRHRLYTTKFIGLLLDSVFSVFLLIQLSLRVLWPHSLFLFCRFMRDAHANTCMPAQHYHLSCEWRTQEAPCKEESKPPSFAGRVLWIGTSDLEGM